MRHSVSQSSILHRRARYHAYLLCRLASPRVHCCSAQFRRDKSGRRGWTLLCHSEVRYILYSAFGGVRALRHPGAQFGRLEHLREERETSRFAERSVMEEIFALQRQLADVQVSTSSSKLSERNCIELVSKLRSLSLVDLIFTRTGKEYLTPAQLEREIEDEILVRGGRVNVIDIPDALNVDLAHIHTALPRVIENAPCRTRVFNGEVVTDDYLETLAEDVNAALTQSATGIDDIGQIASRFSLPVAVVRECVSAHLGSVILATMDYATGELRSHASRKRAVAACVGALRATLAPALLADVAQRLDVPVDIVISSVKEMVGAGSLAGRIDGSGSRSRFIPAVFERAAKSSAISRFAGSGFMSLDSLRALNIADQDSFVQDSLPGAVVVGSLVVGPSVLEALEGSASEALQSGSWLDIGAALPPSFPADHISYMVDMLDYSGKVKSATPATQARAKSGPKSGGKRKGGVKNSAPALLETESGARGVLRSSIKLSGPVLHHKYVVSTSLLDRCVAVVKEDAEARAVLRAKRMLEISSVVSSSNVEQGKKNENSMSTRKSKPRRRKEKESESGDSKPENNRKSLPVDVPSSNDICNLLVQKEGMTDALETDYLGNAPVDGSELLESIVEEGLALEAEGGFASMYEAAASAAVAVLEKELAAARVQLEQAILGGLEEVELYGITAKTLSNIGSEAVESSRALALETVGRQAMVSILEFVACCTDLKLPSSETTKTDLTSTITTLQNHLPRDASAKVKPIVSSVLGKTSSGIEEFLVAYDEATEGLDLPPRRPLDKKRERAVNANVRSELEDIIREEKPPGLSCIRALSVCATLLHAKCRNGAIVCLPTGLVPALCDYLETQGLRSEEQRVALADFRSAVTDELRSSVGKEPPALSKTLREKLEKVTGFLLEAR